MSGFNLPPGVSQNDLDRAAGCYDEACLSCDEVVQAFDLCKHGYCYECVQKQCDCDPV